MKQNTPLRLLAVAAATALVFTACGGDDDNAPSGGRHPGGSGTGVPYGGTPNPGGNPWWYTPTPPTPPTPTNTTDTPTPPTPPTNTNTDTGSSDTDTNTDTSSTDTSDACSDPSSTDTTCVPTGAVVKTKSGDGMTLPMAVTDDSDDVTITLTPKAVRKLTVTFDPSTIATGTVEPKPPATEIETDKNGIATVKVKVPDGNASEFIDLRVKDNTVSTAEFTATPTLLVCDATNPEPICAPTKAISSDTHVSTGTTVTFTLTPEAAAKGREVIIVADNADIRLDGGSDNTARVTGDPTTGEAKVTVTTLPTSLTTGDNVTLAVHDMTDTTLTKPIGSVTLTVN